jgi:hypothetical protein
MAYNISIETYSRLEIHYKLVYILIGMVQGSEN